MRAVMIVALAVAAIGARAEDLGQPTRQPTKNPDVMVGFLYRCEGKQVTFSNVDGPDCKVLSSYFIPTGRPGLNGYTVIYNDDRVAILNYRDRFTRSGDVRSSWIMYSFVDPQQFGAGTYTRSAARVTVNCVSRSYQTGQATLYSVSGDEIENVGGRFAGKPEEAPPNSLGDVVVTYLCNEKTAQ